MAVARIKLPRLAPSSFSRARRSGPRGWGLIWDRPFQPPATQKQAANGQPNYRDSVDRSELVWSTSVGGVFHINYDVAHWHFSDLMLSLSDVCSSGSSGRRSGPRPSPKMTPNKKRSAVIRNRGGRLSVGT